MRDRSLLLCRPAPHPSVTPSGYFLLGDRLNSPEPHYVWLTGFFMAEHELTNAEFGEYIDDPAGYRDDSNWTANGKRWESTGSSRASALMRPADPDSERFGRPDPPVVQVNWYEANAYCRWLIRKWGGKGWLFSLPNEAEWEKAARGPDSFDYGLGNTVSDAENHLYNWKKNPGAEVTVVGVNESRRRYSANPFGLFHMTCNASEWTQSR